MEDQNTEIKLQGCLGCEGRPQTALVRNFPGVFIGCSNKCGRLVCGKDYKQAATFWNLLK